MSPLRREIAAAPAAPRNDDPLRYDPPALAKENPMPDLLEAIENGVAWLTLNRPERLNALSAEMTGALTEALNRLATDRAVGCVVITGAGRGWCAGGDVKSMEARGRDQTVEDRVEGLRHAHQLPLLMRNCPKPIIAMINGPVAGAGLGLALACDLRVAGKSARFGTAFVRIGYSGDYGGTWSLTRLVGTAKARELYLLGDVIAADEAYRLGMVNRLVDDEKLRDETMTLARRLADGPRVALGYIKKNLFAAETEPFQTVLDLEAEHQARCAFTEDHKEAVAAFNEKRPPVFKGM
jgi:2-(1,2-epoxy-1,2-dihydrophenyl)acetyl-CoA isomerase